MMMRRSALETLRRHHCTKQNDTITSTARTHHQVRQMMIFISTKHNNGWLSTSMIPLKQQIKSSSLCISYLVKNNLFQIHNSITLQHNNNKMMSTTSSTDIIEETKEEEDKATKEKLTSILSSIALAKRTITLSKRHDEIMKELTSSSSSSSSSSSQHNNQQSTSKELSYVAPIANLYTQFQELVSNLDNLNDLLTEASGGSGRESNGNNNDNNNDENEEDIDVDEDMIELCQEEIRDIEEQLTNLGSQIKNSIIPRNDDDYGSDMGAILELRAGTGGDEAALFTSELMDAYQKSAKSMGWKFEILSLGKTDIGGIKEAAISISSNSGGGGYGGSGGGGGGNTLSPYGYFKFESGVHRVQRVPVNDVRIHTSASSVAVLPAPADTNNNNNSKDLLLPTSELRIETMRASGAGGQHVNTTDSAVRITHIPTGITAAIQDERSQHKNKAKAMKLITARVRDEEKQRVARERGDVKQGLMGGGDRSERIRTYNYPQDRVTDHRCKHSEHGINKLLKGDGGSGSGGGGGGEVTGLVGVFAPFLRSMEKETLLQEIEENEEKDNNTDTGSKKKRKKK